MTDTIHFNWIRIGGVMRCRHGEFHLAAGNNGEWSVQHRASKLTDRERTLQDAQGAAERMVRAAVEHGSIPWPPPVSPASPGGC